MIRKIKKQPGRKAGPCPNCERYKASLAKVVGIINNHWCLDDDVRHMVAEDSKQTGIAPQALASQLLREALQERAVETAKQLVAKKEEAPDGG